MTDIEKKDVGAKKTVKKYMLGALGVGIVPIPLLDTALISGIQLKMIHSLADIYNVEFSKHLAKSIVASLLGGSVPLSFSVNLSSLIKSVPLYGQITGMVSVSLFGSASTYAVGRVFIQHFESGGTFLTLDPRKVREYYAKQLKKGKEEIKKNFVGMKP